MKNAKGKLAFLVFLLVLDWALFDSKYRHKIQDKINALGGKFMDKVTSLLDSEDA